MKNIQVDVSQQFAEDKLQSPTSRYLAIDVDAVSDADVPDGCADGIWITELNLFNSDRQFVLDTSQLINDRIINAAQILLMKQYLTAEGLKNTIDVAAGKICLHSGTNTNMVQILHDSSKNHWITVTTKNCVSGHVSVMCSLQQLPSISCAQTLSTYAHIAESKMTLDVLKVSKQTDSVSRGLFAIAFAEAVLRDADPCNLVLDETKMRNHLINCFTKGCISAFPLKSYRTVRKKIIRSSTFQLHCLCRSIYVAGSNMLQCKLCLLWVHPMCVSMNDSTFDRLTEPSVPYVCPQCYTRNAEQGSDIRKTYGAPDGKQGPRNLCKFMHMGYVH
jgi:hypothetical protein